MAGPVVKGLNSIANDLATNDAEKALSAAQGVVLDGRLDDADAKFEAWVPQGYIYGLELVYATAGTLTVKAGTAKDDSDTDTMKLSADITKNVLSSFVVGTTNGAQDSTMTTTSGDDCHVFLIKNPTSGVVDVLVSNSYSSPTLPSGFTLKRWVGALIFTGTNTLPDFLYDDDWIWYDVEKVDINTSATSPTNFTMSVPTGRRFKILGQIYTINNSTGGGFFVHPPDFSYTSDIFKGTPNIGYSSQDYRTLITNSSGQLRGNVNLASTTGRFHTLAYKLSR